MPSNPITKPRLSVKVFRGLELFATNDDMLIVLAGDKPVAETGLTQLDMQCAVKARAWLEQMRAWRLSRGRPLFDVAQSEQAARAE